MSEQINYEDLYEEFLQYTTDSSSSSSQQSCPVDSDRNMAEPHEDRRQGRMNPVQQILQEQEEPPPPPRIHPGPAWLSAVQREPGRVYVLQQRSPSVVTVQGLERVASSTPSPASTEISNQSTATTGSSSTLTPEPDSQTQIDENPIYPGGIDAIWKGVPTEFQSFIFPTDVSDLSRQRGYFTVSELLALKRTLVIRYNEANPNSPFCPSVAATLSRQQKLPPAKRSRVTPATASSSTESLPSVPEKTVIHVDNNGPGPSTAAGPSNSNNLGLVAYLPSLAPPPPYRTATLILRLLQVGNCVFRSFSELIPNRIRVIFNTERIIYECQLPIVPPMRESFQSLRKVLTIDVAFDQISSIGVGIDTLLFRVEGAPQLTVSYHPVSQGDKTVSNITREEKVLLEQIEVGQMRLSPSHQLIFINERILHALVCQFKEYPRFQNIIRQLPDRN